MTRLRREAGMISPGLTIEAGGRITGRAAMFAPSVCLARPAKREQSFADINPNRTTTCEY